MLPAAAPLYYSLAPRSPVNWRATSHLGRTALAAIGTISVLIFVTSIASADRKPTRAERDEILIALPGDFACDTYPPNACRVDVRISTKNESWAGAYVRPTSGHGDTVQPVNGSLERKRGRWRVNRLGPDTAGCGMPGKVRDDLRLFCFHDPGD